MSSEFESINDQIISKNDYQLVESNNIEFYGVKLLTGKWKDVVYIYGKVSIKESPELDIATLTYGQVVSEEIGVKLENIDLKMLGSANRVILTKEETTIVEGIG